MCDAHPRLMGVGEGAMYSTDPRLPGVGTVCRMDPKPARAGVPEQVL